MNINNNKLFDISGCTARNFNKQAHSTGNLLFRGNNTTQANKSSDVPEIPYFLDQIQAN